MIPRLFFSALAVVDAVLIVAAIFGWRPCRGVFGAIRRHALHFLLVFFGALIGLTVAIPLIDVILFTRGIVLPDDYMLFVAPALTLFLSASAALLVVRKLETR